MTMEDLYSGTGKTTKLHSWVVTLSLTAAAVVFYFAVFRPTEQRIVEVRQEIDEMRQFIQATDLVTLAIGDIEQETGNVVAFVDKSRQAAPTEKELPQLYRDINAMMKKHEVSTKRFDPGESVAMNTLAQSPLSLAASGTFAQVFALIASIDDLPGPSWIQDLSLKSDGRNRGVVEFEANLVIFTDSSKISD